MATRESATDPTGFRGQTGYMPLEQYGLIGNMHTSALVATDGAIDMMCWPDFDSPSVFARILDKDKGGHFSISPPTGLNFITKQQYLPSNNILQTRHLGEDGVLNLLDFFPRPRSSSLLQVVHDPKSVNSRVVVDSNHVLKRWLVRRVECIRGECEVHVEVFPAFNYAQDPHATDIVEAKDSPNGEYAQSVYFKSKDLSLQLNATFHSSESNLGEYPTLQWERISSETMLGDGVKARIILKEGQRISFVLRDLDDEQEDHITTSLLDTVQKDTSTFWYNWISMSKYTGRWREIVNRGLMILKMLVYEPTGAIVAAPTFSLPEDFGGGRNWDYRFSWVRDSSFSLYILLRMGFSEEAEAYMSFISDRLKYSRNPATGALPIMFSIRGSADLPEIELNHLSGHRNSRPVRIGNGAAFHKQLDIYGELMDAIYLYNKFGKPVSYDQWIAVRELTDYVTTIWQEQDASIWEVRGQQQNYVYSKIMLWVAMDRACRLAEKRCFPCPNRTEWLRVRDQICEDVNEKGFNKQMGAYVQSYESPEMLDAATLIAPLVFFCAPNDPRFLGTLDAILQPPEKGGLTSTGLVYRYNWAKSDDGVGGEEGAFVMTSFWLVEAMTRAAAYEKSYLVKAINMFETMLGFSNHLFMFSEEIARTGEQLGNTPQAFSHLAMISAAFNLDRVASNKGPSR